MLAAVICMHHELSAQRVNKMKDYDFQEFISLKTLGERAFLGGVYGKLKYPRENREIKIEGMVEVILFSNGKDPIQYKLIGEDVFFKDAVNAMLLELLEEVYISTDNKYKTSFEIWFSLDTIKVDRKPNRVYINVCSTDCFIYTYCGGTRVMATRILDIPPSKIKWQIPSLPTHH